MSDNLQNQRQITPQMTIFCMKWALFT